MYYQNEPRFNRVYSRDNLRKCNSTDKIKNGAYIVNLECNSHETSNLSAAPLDNQQFRLNKINEIKNYFIAQIKERELMSKTLSKYIASFDNFDKYLIVLSATSRSISIASFASVIGTPVGIASARFSLAFSLSTGLMKVIKNNKK